jgi:hypothetical protein
MPTIHELLDDTQQKCTALVKEMETFKSARLLNQKAADALDATCAALQNTTKAIAPLTELRVRRMTIILLSITGLNFVMFLATLLIVVLKH